MGKRGPQAGARRAVAVAASAVAASAAAQALTAAHARAQQHVEPPAPLAPTGHLTAADRINPEKLAGDDLKALGHQRGLSKSAMATMSDEKIRLELRYITQRQIDNNE